MRVSSVLFAVLVLILVISLLCIWFVPSIQDFMASNTMWNGINDFRQEFRAINIATLGELPELPRDIALLAIPYLEYSNEELSRIKRFVEDGGTLLLMDDYGYGNSVMAYLGAGVRFTNKPLLDPLFCYKNQWLPKITDLAPEVREGGVEVLVLNHATTLTGVNEAEVIAWSSTASFLDSNENESWDAGESGGPFPVATMFRLGKGNVAVATDPSIMINSMVDRDNNYRFMRYLTMHQDGQKKILIDESHLSKTPLDVSKTRLYSIREILATPYPLLGAVLLIFISVSRYTLKIGENIG